MKTTDSSLRAALFFLFALFATTSTTLAAVVNYQLQFDTTGQSIWDTGTSFKLDESKFIGAEWNDATISIDGIAGNENSTLPNPLRTAYDVAFNACRLLASASVCINGQTAQVGVPALGNRPSVRSCGLFAVACQALRLADIARRTAYDAAFAACTLGFSATVCRNGRPTLLPVVALGTAPSPFLNVDTRTGVALSGTTDGRIGLQLGVSIDSGSVDATVSYKVSLDIPDTKLLDKANAINFNPNSVLDGINTLDTSFSNLSMSVDAVMQLSGGITAEGCLIGPGCASGGTTFAIDKTAPVLSFNEDGQGGILLLGRTPSDLGVHVNGFPLALDIAGLATATLYLPAPDATGGLDAAKKKLKATGQDDLFDLDLDLDNIVASAASLPGLFGRGATIPVLGSVSYDIIDVKMGPHVDLQQDFELDPTLFVSLAFDKAVEIGGQLVTKLVTAWDQLPSIKFLDDVTRVTPTFFVQADLRNRTLLDFDLNFAINLLQIDYDFGLFGKGKLGIGNVLNRDVDLFDTPAFYEKLFQLNGFNLQVGDSFVIDFRNGSTGPASAFAAREINPIVLAADPDTVPEPGTALLVALGLVVLLVRRGKPRGASANGRAAAWA